MTDGSNSQFPTQVYILQETISFLSMFEMQEIWKTTFLTKKNTTMVESPKMC